MCICLYNCVTTSKYKILVGGHTKFDYLNFLIAKLHFKKYFIYIYIYIFFFVQSKLQNFVHNQHNFSSNLLLCKACWNLFIFVASQPQLTKFLLEMCNFASFPSWTQLHNECYSYTIHLRNSIHNALSLQTTSWTFSLNFPHIFWAKISNCKVLRGGGT